MHRDRARALSSLPEGDKEVAMQEFELAVELASKRGFDPSRDVIPAAINPQHTPAWAELGTNSYLAGEYAKGAEYFRKALTIDPGQAAYHY